MSDNFFNFSAATKKEKRQILGYIFVTRLLASSILLAIYAWTADISISETPQLVAGMFIALAFITALTAIEVRKNSA